MAAAWSAGYGVLALWCVAGSPGAPSGLVDPGIATDAASWGVLTRLEAGAVAVLAFLASALAATLSRSGARGFAYTMLIASAWIIAVTLVIGVPDARAVAAVAYAPVFVLGAPFGWPPVPFSVVVPWSVLNQLICLVGGIVWSLVALVATRRARGACPSCGRRAVDRGWASPAAAARWGRWSTYVAITIPLLYATTRLAWAAGVPLGITDVFLREGQEIGMWKAGASLAAVAIAGAGLTSGLVRPWGEVYPGWLPVLRGRPVPAWVAIAPAALMSCLFVSAGLDAVVSFVRDGFPEEGWGTTAPTLLWPAWGLALGAATLAYHFRRRGPCGRCGRGHPTEASKTLAS